MAWIESHQGLATHPKLLRLATISGHDIDICISKLHRLWWWCLSYAEDGELSRFNPEEIGLGIGINDKEEAIRFLDALKQSNWIDNDNFLHDWLDYAGRYLKTKYKTSNPEKCKNIFKKHSGRTKGKTKGKPRGQPKVKHIHNIQNKHNLQKQNEKQLSKEEIQELKDRAFNGTSKKEKSKGLKELHKEIKDGEKELKVEPTEFELKRKQELSKQGEDLKGVS